MKDLKALGGTPSSQPIRPPEEQPTLSAEQMLSALRDLIPSFRAFEVESGLWRVTSDPKPRVLVGLTSGYFAPSGETKDAAIKDAFETLTKPGVVAQIDGPAAGNRVEAQWNGKAWDFEVGSAELVKQWSNAAPELVPMASVATGQVSTKFAAPAFTTVGAVHLHDKAKTEAMQLIDRGFAADSMKGGFAKALGLYQEGLDALKAEVVEKFEATHPDLKTMRTTGDLERDLFMFHATLDAIGLSHEPSVVDVAKKLYNRTGLALKHQADSEARLDLKNALYTYGAASIAIGLALDVDPGYGAAHYNQACIQWRGMNDAKGALASLARAIEDKSFDYAGQAIHKDTDWNSLRGSPAFQQVVGL